MRARSLATLTLLLASVAFVGCDSNDEDNQATVRGSVVNADTDDPIAGAFVRITGGGDEFTTRTDSAGAYELSYEFEDTQEQSGDRSTTLSIEAFADGFQDDSPEGIASVVVFAGESRTAPRLRLLPVGSDGGGPGTGGGTSGPARSVTLLARTEQAVTVAGAGGENEVAALTFVVSDAQGRPVSSANAVDLSFRICRNFDGPSGDITCISDESEANIPDDATLDTYSATTAADGTATVYMTSGTQARSVQIRAQFSSGAGDVIRSEPVTIGITGGLPDQANFSVVVEQPNFAPAGTVANVSQEVTAFVGDRYNNPVAPGTQVYFTTTGGIIEGSAFTDDLGRATVQLISTAILPSGQAEGDGFSRVTASTLGVGGANVNASTLVLFSATAAIRNVDARIVGGRYVIDFTVSDQFGNPLGPGTSVDVSVEGENVAIVSGESFGYDGPQLFPGPGVTEFTTEVAVDDPEEEASIDSFTISVSSPNGNRTLTVPVNVTLP
jgi:hypothetical protein